MVAHAKAANRDNASSRKDSIKTEVGEIPSDWIVVSAGDVGKFRGGNGFPLRYQGKKAAPLPYFKVSDMSLEGNERCLRTANNYIEETDRQKLGAYVFPENSIVIAKVGAAVFLERKKLLAQPSCLDNNLAGYWITNTKATYSFIHYYLQSIRLSDLVSATALPSLNGAVLGSIKIPLPPTTAEQEAIAEALSDADALIDSLETLIAKKRAIKQGAMQDLLSGRKRLPGFSEEWVVRRFAGLATIRNQKISTLGNSSAAFCVELENLGSNTGRLLDFSDATRRVSSKYSFQKGDVLFGRLRPYLRKFWQADREGVCSTEIWPLMPSSADFLPDYLYQIIQTDGFIEAAGSSYGTHMPRSDWKALGESEFTIPTDTDEQQAIATILAEMDSEVENLEAKLAKARQIKQGMMQELLTGRVRLV